MKKGFLIFILLFSTSAFSVVDMKNANFSKTWKDFSVRTGNFNLDLIRSYNSRSLHTGLFGFGWCSQFDTTLKVTLEGSIRVRECGGGAEYNYYLSGSKPSVYGAVDTILDKIKKNNPSLSASQLKRITKDLRSNSVYKDAMEKQLGLSGKIKPNKKYLLGSNASEFVKVKKGKYIRRLSDGVYQIFNSKGYLIQMTHLKSQNKLNIARDSKGRIKKVSDSHGNQLVFQHKGKTLKVIGPHNKTVTYSFKGENLECVNNSGKKTCYKYDSLNNMTLITYPNKKTEALTYNTDKDWVTSFKHKNGCLEKYNYGSNPKNPLDHYWSHVKKFCNNKKVSDVKYDFMFKKNKNNVRYLHKVSYIRGKKSVGVTYHPKLSRPMLVSKNGQSTKYVWKNGLIRKVLSSKGVYQYAYDNKCKKVKQVKITPKSNKRQLASAKSMDYFFKYKKCEMSQCKTSLGDQVNMLRKQGLLQQATDKRGRKLIFSYDPKTQKVKSLKLPSVGYVVFGYDEQGRSYIKKKSSNKAFIQIITMLNNLYKMIKISEVKVDV